MAFPILHPSRPLALLGPALHTDSLFLFALRELRLKRSQYPLIQIHVWFLPFFWERFLSQQEYLPTL